MDTTTQNNTQSGSLFQPISFSGNGFSQGNSDNQNISGPMTGEGSLGTGPLNNPQQGSFTGQLGNAGMIAAGVPGQVPQVLGRGLNAIGSLFGQAGATGIQNDFQSAGTGLEHLNTDYENVLGLNNDQRATENTIGNIGVGAGAAAASIATGGLADLPLLGSVAAQTGIGAASYLATEGKQASPLGLLGSASLGALPVLGKITAPIADALQISGLMSKGGVNAVQTILKDAGENYDSDVLKGNVSDFLRGYKISGSIDSQMQQVGQVVDNIGNIVQEGLGNTDAGLMSSAQGVASDVLKGGANVMNNLKQALSEKLTTMVARTGSIKAGMEDDYNQITNLLNKPGFSLQDFDNGRGIINSQLFQQNGAATQAENQQGWLNVWKNTTKFIDDNVPGFSEANKTRQIGIAITKAMAQQSIKNSTWQIGAKYGLLGSIIPALGAGVGYSQGGTQGAIQGGVTALAAEAGFAGLKGLLGNPAFSSKIAEGLNFLSRRSAGTLMEAIGGQPYSDYDMARALNEVKMLPASSGEPLSANTVNTQPMTGYSRNPNVDITPNTKIGTMDTSPQPNAEQISNQAGNLNNSTANMAGANEDMFQGGLTNKGSPQQKGFMQTYDYK